MLDPDLFTAALGVAERRAVRRPDAAQTAAVLTSWRAGGLEDDATFDAYLRGLGIGPRELAGRLDPTARAADPDLLAWVAELDAVDATAPRPAARWVGLTYGVQRLDTLPFPDFHAPLVAWLADAVDDLADRLLPRVRLTPHARAEALGCLLSGVLASTLRPLLHDLDLHRRAGGSFAEHRARHATRDGRAATWTAFPVLARDVHRTLRQQTRHLEEMLTRLHADLPDLVAVGLVAPGRAVTGVSLGAGDVHHDGRSVSLLEVGGEQVVYRPQPGRVYEAVRAVDALVARGTGTTPAGPATLGRPTHTWVEFLHHDAAPDATASYASFYRALGRLAGTAWVLGARDLHMENVVATRRGPAVVDQETMLSAAPLRPHDAPARDRCADLLNAGALGAGILPVRTSVGEAGEIDVSVLLGGLEPQPVTVELLAGVDGPDIRVASGEVLSGQRQNLPAGATQERVRRHAPDVADGFRSAVAALRRDPAAVLDAVTGAGSFAVRTVVRPTSLYSLLLHEGRHPRHLRSALAREHLFHRLWGRLDGPYLAADLVAAEVEQLSRGDIPFFEVAADGRTLATGGVAVGEVATSPVDQLRTNLRRATADRTEEQVAVMSEVVVSALTDPVGGDVAQLVPPERPPASGPRRGGPDRPALLDAVVAKFAGTAVLGHDDAGWIGLCSSLESTTLQLRPLGTGLFDGLAGVAVALDLAGAALGDDSAVALAARALVPVSTELRAWVDEPTGPVGAHSGAGGLAFALAVHELLTGSVPAAAEGLLHDYVVAATDALLDDDYLDVCSGTAGALAVGAFLAERGLVGESVVRRLALVGVEHLRRRSVATPDGARCWPTGDAGVALGGFSHGASGIGWALARVAGRDPRAAALATEGLAFDDQHLDPGVGLWRDARPEWSSRDAYPVHWCHGATGIALARGQAARWLGDPELGRAADRAARAVVTRALPGNDSLCHGTFGNAAVLTEVGAGAGAAGYREEALERVAHASYVPGLGFSAATAPGLMTGFAGLLHYLATDLRPDLPHALWLG